MQISIYLDNKMIQKIDRLAKKNQNSRSAFIQDVLQKEIEGKKKQSVFDEVCGVLDPIQGKEWLKIIRKSRLNSTRFE